MWGRSVSRLLENLPEQYRPPRELVDAAKELDRHYIATKYPNSYPSHQLMVRPGSLRSLQE